MIIQFEISESYLGEELENYVTSINSKIMDIDERGARHLIGEVEATCVNLCSVCDESESLFDVFDHDSQRLSDHYEALFSKEGEVYQFLMKDAVEYEWPCDYRNILFIDLIQIIALP